MKKTIVQLVTIFTGLNSTKHVHLLLIFVCQNGLNSNQSNLRPAIYGNCYLTCGQRSTIVWYCDSRVMAITYLLIVRLVITTLESIYKRDSTDGEKSMKFTHNSAFCQTWFGQL